MNLGQCQIKRCDQPAIWQVITEGHPNARPVLTERYCNAHLFPAAWADSPVVYTITISGPHKPNQKGN